MDIIILIFLFILGLSIGSFLNVVIDRLPRGETVIKGRSYCDNCKHVLKEKDLIPVISYIFLRGKCRYCNAKISWQYPIVELSTSVVLLTVYLYVINIYQESILLNFIFLSIIFLGFFTIFISDIKYRIIPDQILVIISLVLFINLYISTGQLLLNHVLSAFLMFILFLFIFIITKGRGMGFGDVKFSFALGLFLGYPKVIVAFYMSFLTGALLSLILIMKGRKKMKDTIPFGPFLIIGAVISFFYGSALWEIFSRLVGI